MQEHQRFIPILKLRIIGELLFTACSDLREYPTSNTIPQSQSESPIPSLLKMTFSGWGMGEADKTQKQAVEQFVVDLHT